MDVYVYRAALLCEECGGKCKCKLTAEGKAPENPKDEHTFDSDNFPKGPYGSDSNESDSVQYCDHCGCFLENPLTKEGRDSLMDWIIQALNDEVHESFSDNLVECIEFYDIELKDLVEHVRQRSKKE